MILLESIMKFVTDLFLPTSVFGKPSRLAASIVEYGLRLVT